MDERANRASVRHRSAARRDEMHEALLKRRLWVTSTSALCAAVILAGCVEHAGPQDDAWVVQGGEPRFVHAPPDSAQAISKAAPVAGAAAFAGSSGSDAPEDSLPAETEFDVAVEELDEVVEIPTWEEYRDTAKAAGGETGHFVVEWDLMFTTEEALRLHYEDQLQRRGSKLAVFSQCNTWSSNGSTCLSKGFEPTYPFVDAVNIVYCIANTMPAKSSVVSDMAAAARAWEDVANVRFKYDPSQDGSCTTNNAQVDFAVLFLAAGSAVGACAANKLMWSQALNGLCLGAGTLGIQSYGVIENQAAPRNNVTMRGTLRHELGHMLGFRHEHPWGPNPCGETPDSQQFNVSGRRLTPYDQKSVMHYQECAGVAGADFTISREDANGVSRIYGPPAWYLSVTGI